MSRENWQATTRGRGRNRRTAHQEPEQRSRMEGARKRRAWHTHAYEVENADAKPPLHRIRINALEPVTPHPPTVMLSARIIGAPRVASMLSRSPLHWGERRQVASREKRGQRPPILMRSCTHRDKMKTGKRRVRISNARRRSLTPGNLHAQKRRGGTQEQRQLQQGQPPSLPPPPPPLP